MPITFGDKEAIQISIDIKQATKEDVLLTPGIDGFYSTKQSELIFAKEDLDEAKQEINFYQNKVFQLQEEIKSLESLILQETYNNG